MCSIQVGGVRFLYDNLIESLTRFHTSTGFGCILAHSMGLGKTLQVISFIDILFRYTPARRVLCVVPVNTLQVMVCVCLCVCEKREQKKERKREGERERVNSYSSLQNWVVEFDKWLPGTEEQQRKTAANKSSRNRHKQRSQQNGCPAKSTDLVLPPSINGLPATRDGVSMATMVAGDNTPQSFPGGGFVSDMDIKTSAMLAGSGTHTANPGTANSRSHTGSPSAPDMQYRSFSLFVLSETYRTMESRLKVIRQWREEGECVCVVCVDFLEDTRVPGKPCIYICRIIFIHITHTHTHAHTPCPRWCAVDRVRDVPPALPLCPVSRWEQDGRQEEKDG